MPNETQGQIYLHYIHQKIFVRKDTQVHFDLHFNTFRHTILFYADPSGRAVYCVVLRPLAVWDRWSASCCRQNVCQVEVYGTGWHSSRGVLPSMVYVIVKSRPRQWGGSDFIQAATLWKPRHRSTYNEIWGAFFQPVLPWKMCKYYIPECVFVSPCIQHAHSPYCNLRSVRLYSIFPPYFVKDTIFEKKNLLNVKACFDFLYNFHRNVSHPEKNWATCGKKKCILFVM